MEPLVAERFRNEEKYREGHIRIINPLPGREIWGLHIPDMRKLARELAAREDAMEIVSGLERAAALGRGCEGALSHEEMTVWGMMINAMKKACRMELLRRYVPYIDNWAVCDTFDSGAGWFRKEAGAWEMLCGYFASGREFEVRFATVMSMCHFLDREYLPRIFFQFDKLDFGKIDSDYLGPAQAHIRQLGFQPTVLFLHGFRLTADILQQGIDLVGVIILFSHHINVNGVKIFLIQSHGVHLTSTGP